MKGHTPQQKIILPKISPVLWIETNFSSNLSSITGDISLPTSLSPVLSPFTVGLSPHVDKKMVPTQEATNSKGNTQSKEQCLEVSQYLTSNYITKQ
jgi:hypothetical protein